MHELSLAQGMLRIIDAQRAIDGFDQVLQVRVQIGVLSCVEPDALRFCFEAVRKDTAAAAAELVLEMIPGRGRCCACDLEAEIETHLDPCPACGAYGLAIQGGDDLRVVSLEVA